MIASFIHKFLYKYTQNIQTDLYLKIQHLGMKTNPSLNARTWSNAELSRFGKLFSGSIVNVSGWRDEDKEGKKYDGYFPNSHSYSVTNFTGARGAENGENNSIYLDLEKPLSPKLAQQFDVVFSHTTLEHVFDINAAADCLAGMSRDIVIIVVPFIQPEHYDTGSYGDYWRFSPKALQLLFARYGFEPVYISANEQHWFPVYVFFIASRHPEKWKDKFPPDSLDILNRKICADYFKW